MQFIIIYFSGTGNTKLIAEQIKKRLSNAEHDVKLISIEDKTGLSKINFEGTIIGFGFPVYKFTYPDNLNKALININELATNNKYFLFSTYTRFAADALYDFSKQLDRNNFTLISQAEFKCPSCGISARFPVDDYEYQSVMFFEDDIGKKIDRFVNEIINNYDVKKIIRQKKSVLSYLKKEIVKNIEITKYPRLAIDANKCTVCGLCTRKCPDSNLIMMQSRIDIIDNKGCLHCLRCINHCPQNAITFGILTKGDNQYTLKIRDELYKKSIDGHKERYWSNFDKVIAKWRKKTVKYWLGNFYRRE